MGFIFAETAGMYGAAVSHEGLAAETNGVGVQTGAAGHMTIPPGLEEVSAENKFRIDTFATHAQAMLAEAAVNQHGYAEATTRSATAYLVADAQSTGLIAAT